MPSILSVIAPPAPDFGAAPERFIAFASTEDTTSGLLLCASVVLLVCAGLLVLRRRRHDSE